MKCGSPILLPSEAILKEIEKDIRLSYRSQKKIAQHNRLTETTKLQLSTLHRSIQKIAPSILWSYRGRSRKKTAHSVNNPVLFHFGITDENEIWSEYGWRKQQPFATLCFNEKKKHEKQSSFKEHNQDRPSRQLRVSKLSHCNCGNWDSSKLLLSL